MNIVKLKECCLVKGGFAFKSESYEKKGIPLIRISNIVEKKVIINSNTVYIDNNEMKNSNEFLIKRGDILVALSGATTGKFGIFSLNEKALLNQRVALIRVYNELVHQKYIYYYFYGLENFIFNKARGVAQPNISTKELEEFKIPLPPLPEQKRIAELLDKADSIRQKRKESIALLDEFLRSVFLDMFGDPVRNEKGWEVKTFKNLVTIERNQISPEDIENDTSYVDLEAIQKETGKIINCRKVQNGYIKSSKFLFNSEHILYGKLRPYLNKVALPNFVGVCSTDILPILPKEKFSNKFFISQLMRSSYFVNYMTEKSSGANLPRVNVQTINGFKSIAPPFNLQTQFAKIVEQVEVTKAKMEESLREMDRQFEGLMGRVFK